MSINANTEQTTNGLDRRYYRPNAREPACGQAAPAQDRRTADDNHSETRFDYLYYGDRSASAVEETQREYFRSIIRADDQVGDWYPDTHIPHKRRRSKRRYWVVDRDKVEWWVKLAGQAVFVGAIAALVVTLIIGIIGG